MEKKDLGFGEQGSAQSNRFINKNGGINVIRKGLPFFRPYDLYHSLISMNWVKFITLITASFFSINLLFALIYACLEKTALSNMYNRSSEIQQFWDSFFFSVQTITTVGYGAMSPESNWAKIISSLESFIGLLGFALVTGLLYGRFSKPIMKIKYSKNILVAPFKEGKALMFKMANQRSSKLIEAEVKVILIGSKNGKRVYHDLPLELKKINFFALSWTVVHPINDKSFLFQQTPKNLKELNAEIVILVKAFDDSFSQVVYSRMSYKYNEFIWNAKFESSIFEEEGKLSIDLQQMDNYIQTQES